MVREDLNIKVGCFLSWPAIILGLIFLFPLGLVQLYMRSKLDPFSKQSVGKFMQVVGIIGIVISVLMIISSIASSTPEASSMVFVFVIFWLIPNIVFWYLGRNASRTASYNIKYLTFIKEQNVTSLQQIAQAVSLSEKKVALDIEDLVKSNVLQGYVVDQNVGIVYPLGAAVNAMNMNMGTQINTNMPGNQQTVTRTETTNNGTSTVQVTTSTSTSTSGFGADGLDAFGDFDSNFAEPPKEVSVACPGCGAPCTLMTGSSMDCEFCGSKVTA